MELLSPLSQSTQRKNVTFEENQTTDGTEIPPNNASSPFSKPETNNKGTT